MASLQELRDLENDSDLQDKVWSATLIAATDLLASATPTDADRSWASFVLNDPLPEGRKCLRFILAENASSSVAQILGASDAQIQANVNQVVPDLVIVFNLT